MTNVNAWSVLGREISYYHRDISAVLTDISSSSWRAEKGLVVSYIHSSSQTITITERKNGHLRVVSAPADSSPADVLKLIDRSFVEGRDGINVVTTRPVSDSYNPANNARKQVREVNYELLRRFSDLSHSSDPNTLMQATLTREVRATSQRSANHQASQNTDEIVGTFELTSRRAKTRHFHYSGSFPSVEHFLTKIENHIRPSFEGLVLLPEPSSPIGMSASDVWIDGSVAAELVGLLSKSLSQDAVKHGRSRFSSKVNQRIGSDIVSIIDDPALEGGPRVRTLDDEGSPTKQKVLVDRGILKEFLGTREHEKAGGSVSSGNAWQSSPEAPCRALGSNIFILPVEKLENRPDMFISVLQTQGIHMANEITGEFSMSAAGVVCLDGERFYVEGMTIAGNVIDMLSDVSATGTRVHWKRGSITNYGSPDLRVGGLSVGFEG